MCAHLKWQLRLYIAIIGTHLSALFLRVSEKSETDVDIFYTFKISSSNLIEKDINIYKLILKILAGKVSISEPSPNDEGSVLSKM